MVHEADFEQILLDAMDETLALLGERGKAALCDYVQSRYGIEKNQIPKELDKFSLAIRAILGAGGFTHRDKCSESYL